MIFNFCLPFDLHIYSHCPSVIQWRCLVFFHTYILGLRTPRFLVLWLCHFLSPIFSAYMICCHDIALNRRSRKLIFLKNVGWERLFWIVDNQLFKINDWNMKKGKREGGNPLTMRLVSLNACLFCQFKNVTIANLATSSVRVNAYWWTDWRTSGHSL